jgi:hypothetical protein
MIRERDRNLLPALSPTVNHEEACETKDPMQDCTDQVETPTEGLVLQLIV